MKRLLVILISSLACLLTVQAQTRYVIAFDCTKSMNHPTGDYSPNGEDPYKIWIPAKKCIHSLWTQASDDDEFVILLYQEKILHTIRGYKGSQLRDWSAIESKMEDAIKNGGNTCILNAWQTSEQYFTDNCDFYFITDGVEDHDNNNQLNDDEQAHIDAICNKIDEFCALGINGFYTNLKQSENDNINNQITQKIKSSCFKDLIAGNISPLSLSLNQEDLSIGKKTFNLTFRPIDSQRIANVQALDAVFVDYDGGLQNASKFFKATISGISNNKIELILEQVIPVPQELLDQANSCKLFLNVLSNDKDVAIFPELITVDVRYYYEKIAYLPSSELEGTSKYHPAFFISSLAKLFSGYDFIAEHKPDTISFDLKKMLNDNTLFNNEAIKHGSSYRLQLVPLREKDKDAKFFLMKNGLLCNNKMIEVGTTDDNLLISIIFDNSSEDGTFKFNLIPTSPNELDKINECANIEEALIPINITYEKNCNPMSAIIISLIILMILVCLIRIFFVRLSYRRLNVHLYYLVDGYEELLLSLDNCTKGVITSRAQKQSFISRLFNGKYCYSNPIKDIEDDIYVNYDSNDLQGNRILRLSSKMNYKINSVNISDLMLTRNEEMEYTISNRNNKQILTIKYF